MGDIEADPKLAVPPRHLIASDKEKKEVQGAAATTLGKMGKAGVATLTAAVKDDATDTDVRRKAMAALGKISPDGKSSTPALILQVKMPGGGQDPSKDSDLRLEAATAWARSPPPPIKTRWRRCANFKVASS